MTVWENSRAGRFENKSIDAKTRIGGVVRSFRCNNNVLAKS